ncbi:MAG: hypothetical protein NT149_02705 [Candidatus Gottesmanbacteria bacterium]|nr:hypothetical protein [Candidatus Gottesmanbacteria bacterium]
MAKFEALEQSCSRRIHIGRYLTEFLFRGPLNYEVSEDTGGILKAEDALSSGDGLVIGLPHFSKRDGLIYGTYALHFAKLRNVPLVLPMALHQFKDFEPAMHMLERICDGVVCPIVIDDTVQQEKYKELSQGQGMREYLRVASEAIKSGGIVAISLQGGRKAFLGEPVPALSTLLAFLHRRSIQNFAVHFAGITPAQTVEPSAFEELKGWNLGVSYIVKPGNTYSFGELNRQFDFNSKDSLKPINAWGYRELAKLVQPSYCGTYGP